MSDTRTLHPQERISVVKSAEHWQQVIAILAKAPVPYEVVAPLIHDIQAQCMRPRTAELHALHPNEEEAS